MSFSFFLYILFAVCPTNQLFSHVGTVIWFFLGSICAFLIDTTRPPELETDLVIDCLFFVFSCHLEKYHNAV